MGFEIGILLGLTAAICFGTADFLSKTAVQKLGFYKALLYYQVTGIGFIILTLLFFWEFPVYTIDVVKITAVIALFNTLAFLLFFKALHIGGKVSLISPIVNLWPAVTTILAIVILGNQLAPLQLMLLPVIFFAIFLIGFEYKGKGMVKSKKEHFTVGLFYALIGVLLFGVGFFLADYLVAITSGLIAVFSVRLMTFLYLSAFAPIVKINIHFPKGRIIWILLAMGIVDTIGYIAFYTGINIGMMALVAPAVSLAPLSVVTLARIFYKEKIRLNQKIGIVIAVISLVVLALV